MEETAARLPWGEELPQKKKFKFYNSCNPVLPMALQGLLAINI